jgi:tetratricopeptide (TPR) repeat protein
MLNSNNDVSEPINTPNIPEDRSGRRPNEEYGASRYEESLAVYEQILKINPLDAYAYSGKGAVLSDLNRFDEALAAYEKAIQLRPNNADAYIGKGDVLKGMGRMEEAEQAYEKARELGYTV